MGKPNFSDEFKRDAVADPDARLHAIPAVRALIDRIIMTSNPNGQGVEIDVRGKLAAIVRLATGDEPPEPLTAKLERVKGIGRYSKLVRGKV